MACALYSATVLEYSVDSGTTSFVLDWTYGYNIKLLCDTAYGVFLQHFTLVA